MKIIVVVEVEFSIKVDLYLLAKVKLLLLKQFSGNILIITELCYNLVIIIDYLNTLAIYVH